MVTKTTKAPDVQDVTAKPEKPDYSALDALEKEAQKDESTNQQQASQAAQKSEKQAIDTLAADLKSALDMAAAPARPAMWWLTDSEFEALWGDKVRAAIADPGAEIMRRHGLNMGGLMSQYGPYIGLMAAVGPSLAATVSVYKTKKQAQLSNEVPPNDPT